ncbi:MAG: Crp/Fnr family transcriptional regulator [Desulfovibrio sp.]|jgi:CRP-like cAMP-binding protein
MLRGDIDFLRELQKPGFETLARAFLPRNYPAKSLIFIPREERDLVFIVTRGRARVYLAYEDKEFTLALLERGDVYSTHTRAYVAALKDTTIMCAETAHIRRQLLRIPEFTVTMVRVLGDVLSHSINIIDNLAFLDVGRRLKCFLLYERERAEGKAGQSCQAPSAQQPETGVLLELGLTTEHLATLLGTTRQTLSTILNALAKEGLVELRGRGRIYIPDPTALE